MSSIQEKLFNIQQGLKVEKKQYNRFGGFSYRSKEDILEAVKPLLKEQNCTLVCQDTPICNEAGWSYMEARAFLTDVETGDTVQALGFAREPEVKKGMDASQITGTASSYAGKRALGNLFAIDDTADSDAYGEAHEAPKNKPYQARCKTCGNVYEFPAGADLSAYRFECCANPNYEVI